MKKAIIIGATSGIGRGVAKVLTENDYIVGITGRHKTVLNEIKNERPGNYFTSSFDIRDTINIPFHLNTLTKELGGLDLLLICSGTGDLNGDLEFEIEKQTIDTNISGFTAVAAWAYNYFEKIQGGHLAAITSVGGMRGSRSAPAYNASKAFQINYLEGLRQKAFKSGYPIVITDIRPGFVNTAMAKGDGQFWVGTVEKVSRQIYKAIIKKRKVVYVTRRWILIALGLSLLPGSIYKKL